MRVSDDDGIKTVTFDRPEVRNAFTLETARELSDVVAETERDETDVIVITGEGDSFSSGGDIMSMAERIKEEGTANEAYEELKSSFCRVFEEIWTSDVPVVAKINGDAVGAGTSIATVADISYAVEGARFGAAFVRVGLIPDTGGSFLLPRIIGLKKAKELAFTGELFSAEDAVDYGIVNDVVPEEDFDDFVEERVERLAKQPSVTIGLIKKAIHENSGEDWHTALENETNYQIQAYQTDAHEEGVKSFLENREPDFD